MDVLYSVWDRCPRIAVFGDVMVDVTSTGVPVKLSAEAPIPILRNVVVTRNLGGSANVAANLKSLGATVQVYGVVGDDEHGRWVQEQLGDTVLTDNTRCTTLKHRVFSQTTQLVRMDSEQTAPVTSTLVDKLLELFDAATYDAIVIADHNKGLVTARLARHVIASGVPVLVDPKSGDISRYAGCAIFKPNLSEARLLARSVKSAPVLGAMLQRQLACRLVVVTASEKGMCAVPGEDRHCWCPVRSSRDVVNVCGAGDTVAAACALWLALYPVDATVENPFSMLEFASLCADIVVHKPGTAVPCVRDFLSAPRTKTVTLEQLVCIRKRLAIENATVVLTNGCFDLWHHAHLEHLRLSKNEGDVLIVAINSDASVGRLKGPTRPIVDQDHRAAKLSVLPCVDFVIVFEEDTPETLLKAIHPDVLTKGDKDYNIDQVLGREWAGRVVLTHTPRNYSTTDIVRKCGGTM